jgi:hypothetical protein
VHFVLDEAADEMDVSRQSVEPRDNQWATKLAGLLQGGGETGSKQQRICSGASLNILMPRFDGKTFVGCKRDNGVSLGVKPQAAAALFTRTDSQIPDCY